MTIILRRPWSRQPLLPTPVDRSNPLTRGLIFAACGTQAVLPTGGVVLMNRIGVGTTVLDNGFAFSGASTAVAQWDFATNQIAAGDAVTISAIVSGSSFPSLANIAAWSNFDDSAMLGQVGPNVDWGLLRGIISFTGGPPCDVYWWGGNNDYDSNIQFDASLTPQHIVVTKAAGTGAVEIRIYRNGVLIANGNSSNAQPFVGTGRYFYVGGRHVSGVASITGSVRASASWRRALSSAEVLALWLNPWQLFAPRRIIIPVEATAAAPTLSDLRPINVGATSTQWSIDYAFA